MTRVLDIEDLTKGFTLHHLGGVIEAFDRVSFSVDAGEFVLLKGANGRGNRRSCARFIAATPRKAGAIRFQSAHGEIDLARAADIDVAFLRRTEIGFVTQFLTARPRVSAEALVAEPLRLDGWDAEPALDEARRWLAAFGVKPELWRAYPTTFSGENSKR